MVRKTFPEATHRLYHRVFVCRKCKSKIRADYAKIRDKKVKCRNKFVYKYIGKYKNDNNFFMQMIDNDIF